MQKEDVSLFKTLLASLGIGSARIDLVLDRDEVVMGEKVTGQLYVYGGNVEQVIEGLSVDLRLKSRHVKTGQDMEVTVCTIEVTDEEFTLRPGVEMKFPFSFVCPFTLPISSINTKYYFMSNLEIDNGVDAKDRDFIRIKPVGPIKQFLEGMSELGLELKAEGLSGDEDEYLQMFQFHPADWLKGQTDEIIFWYDTVKSKKELRGFFELKGQSSAKGDLLIFDLNQLATRESAAETIRAHLLDQLKGLQV
jgi:sporulation-control protein